jgi:hypothetical protein
MRAQSIRQRLAEGPCTWPELAAATGYDEHRCMIEVSRLQALSGCTIEYRQVTHVVLMYDPENLADRTCAWPGCQEKLRLHNGTGYCGVHTQTEAQRRWRALTPAQRAELAEDICGDGAAALALFDKQLSIDEALA